MHAQENCDVAVVDIPNAFAQTVVSNKDAEHQVIVRIRGPLVDVLVGIAPDVYGRYVSTNKKGQKVLIVKLQNLTVIEISEGRNLLADGNHLLHGREDGKLHRSLLPSEFCLGPVDLRAVHPAAVVALAGIVVEAVIVQDAQGIAVVDQWNTTERKDDAMHQQRYPGLALAWDALAAPAGTTAVLNASNEVAVEFFLQQKIRFDQIHEVNLSALSALQPAQPDHLDDLLKIDEQARAVAVKYANKLSKI
jgi:hypothetical protein